MKATMYADQFAITEITTAGLRETRGIVGDGLGIADRVKRLLADPIEVSGIGDPWVREQLLAAAVGFENALVPLDCELPRN